MAQEDIKLSTEDLKKQMEMFPHWVKDYLKKGASVFTDEEINLLKRVAIKYERDFLPFIEGILDHFVTPKTRRVRKNFESYAELVDDLRQTKDLIGKVVLHIADITDEGHEPSIEDVRGLFETLHLINEKMQAYQELARSDQEFNEQVEKIKEDTGIDLDTIERTGEVVSRETQKFVPERTRVERLKAGAPKTYELLTGIGKGAMTGLLGPFAQIASVAVETIKGITQKRREERIERGRLELERYTTQVAHEAPIERIERQQPLRERGRGIRAKKPVESPRRQAEETMQVRVGDELLDIGDLPPQVQKVLLKEMKATPTGERGAISGLGVGTSRKSAGLSKEASLKRLSEGMLHFFNTEAYNARWTKDLLESIQNTEKHAKEGGKGGGLLETLFGGGGGIFGRGLNLLGRTGLIKGAVGALGRTALGRTGLSLLSRIPAAKTLIGTSLVGRQALRLASAGGGVLGKLGFTRTTLLPALTRVGGVVGRAFPTFSRIGARALPLAGRAGALGSRAIPYLGWALAGALGIGGGISGWKKAGETFGTATPTMSQRVSSTLGGVVSGLTGIIPQKGAAQVFERAAEWRRQHPVFGALSMGFGGLGMTLPGLLPQKRPLGEVEAVTKRPPLGEVVVTGKGEDVSSMVEAMGERIEKAISSLGERIQSSKQETTATIPRIQNDDAYNTKDPWVDIINTGNYGVAV